MFLSSLGIIKNRSNYVHNNQNYQNNLNSLNNKKSINTFCSNSNNHKELMLSNKYTKMLVERDEKSRIMRHLLLTTAGEPEIKKPSLLSLIVVASLLGVSFYFYNRGAIIINS